MITPCRGHWACDEFFAQEVGFQRLFWAQSRRGVQTYAALLSTAKPQARCKMAAGDSSGSASVWGATK
jgi:hypothetical protein